MLGGSMLFPACSFTPKTTNPTLLSPPPKIATVLPAAQSGQKASIEAEKPLEQAEAAASTMQSPQLNDALNRLRAWWSQNLASWNTLVEAAKAQDAVIVTVNKAVADRDRQIATLTADVAKLKTADPVASQLRIWGILALVIGIGCLVAGIVWNIVWVRTASFIPLSIGLVMLTLAQFLRTIEYAILIGAGGAVIAGIVWLLLHRKVVSDMVKAELPDTLKPS